MKKIILSLIVISTITLKAEEQTFIREYTYDANELDTKITSRAIAIDQVKKLLLEEIGIYIEREFKLVEKEENNIYSELSEWQITSITAGVTSTKIMEEKWDGKTYYLKASIKVDPDEVLKNINRIAADKSKLKELEEVKKRAEEAYAEIERLRSELTSVKSENEKLILQKKYSETSNILSSSDWYQKGYDALERKEFDNAVLFFKNAITLNPDFATAYNNLGIAYFNKDDYDSAIINFEKAIVLYPEYTFAYYNLGNAFWEIGDLHAAFENYKKAYEINSNELNFYIEGGIDNTEYDKIILKYENAIISESEEADRFGSGIISYSNEDDINSEIENNRSVLKFNPDSWKSLNDLGVALMYKGEITEAIRCLKKANELCPESSIIYYNLGLTGTPLRSRVCNIQAIQLNPEYTKAYYNLATEYLMSGIFDSAILNFEKSIELDDKFADSYNNLGIVYLNKNELEKAILNFTKAIESDPLNANYYFNIGIVLERKEDLNSAITNYNKAIELDSNHIKSYTNLGSIYNEIGNYSKQVENYKKAAQLGHVGCQKWLKDNGYDW